MVNDYFLESNLPTYKTTEIVNLSSNYI